MSKKDCIDLDTLFFVTSTNNRLEYQLDLKKYYTMKTDSTIMGTVEYGAKKLGNDSLKLYINQDIGSFRDNFEKPDILFEVRDLDTDILYVYKKKNDPFRLSEEYIKKYYNSGVFIGQAIYVEDGYLRKYNFEKGFNICIEEAIKIGEENTVKLRESKYFEKASIRRSEYSKEPFWIYTIETNYGKKYSHIIDGVTGDFKRTKSLKYFPGTVRVKNPKARKNNRMMMMKRKDSIDKILEKEN